VPDGRHTVLTRHPPDEPRDRPSQPTRHVPGEQGVWVLIFGDMLLFTMLFGAYLNSRSHNRVLFAESQAALNQTLGAINTLVLLCSSMLIVLAVLAMRSARWRHLSARLTLAGALVGSCFVVVKVVEYHEKVTAGITPSTNEFFLYYFALTGLHLVHVIVGLTVLTVLWRLARKPEATRTRVAVFEGGGCFWHMVDLLWLIIFPLVFLVH
jgi:nitric oxide reductase NorE protein